MQVDETRQKRIVEVDSSEGRRPNFAVHNGADAKRLWDHMSNFSSSIDWCWFQPKWNFAEKLPFQPLLRKFSQNRQNLLIFCTWGFSGMLSSMVLLVFVCGDSFIIMFVSVPSTRGPLWRGVPLGRTAIPGCQPIFQSGQHLYCQGKKIKRCRTTISVARFRKRPFLSEIVKHSFSNAMRRRDWPRPYFDLRF